MCLMSKFVYAAINHLVYVFLRGRGSDWVCENLLMKIWKTRKERSDLIDVDLNKNLKHVEYFHWNVWKLWN